MSRQYRIAWGVFCLFLLRCTAPAQSPGIRDASEVKAAMLFNFTRFVNWPKGTERDLTIGLAADVGFIGIFERMVRGRTVDGRAVLVKRIDRPGDAAACDVLFVAETARGRWRGLHAAIAGRSVLTVSDMPDFAAYGGIIGLFEEDSRLRFEINIAAARSAGVRLRAQLLKLARVVEHPAPKGQG